MQCGATLALITAIEHAAAAGDTTAVADIAGRMKDYIGESSAGWCDFHDTVDDAHKQAAELYASGSPDEAVWALFDGLSRALRQVHRHLELARAVHLTATELELLEAGD